MRLKRQLAGNVIEIDSSSTIGSGGEANVYAVTNQLDLAAKIYHRPTKERARKLSTMLAHPPGDPTSHHSHIAICWPIDLLTPAGTDLPVGFLMPRIQRMRPVIDVYNPGIRRRRCPLFSSLYLHRTARNIASAVHTLHTRGYIIGDLNESNLFVTDTALVTLVDTDSFQVCDAHSRTVFRCPVGKPEFTPPELQGKAFASIDRSMEHDRFGLAALMFLLLMEGTHPFSGVYTGTGEPPPYEARIRAGHFPYARRGRVPFVPTRTSPPFEILHPSVQRLFHRCFEDGHRKPRARPDAETWMNTLMEAEQDLITCSANPQHRFGRHLRSCPWCERSKQLGDRDPFPSALAVQQGVHLKPAQAVRTPITRSRQRETAKVPRRTRTPPPTKPVSLRIRANWMSEIVRIARKTLYFALLFAAVRFAVACAVSGSWCIEPDWSTPTGLSLLFVGTTLGASIAFSLAGYRGFVRRLQQLSQQRNRLLVTLHALASGIVGAVELPLLMIHRGRTVPRTVALFVLAPPFVCIFGSVVIIGLDFLGALWRLLGWTPAACWGMNGAFLGIALATSEAVCRMGYPKTKWSVVTIFAILMAAVAYLPRSDAVAIAFLRASSSTQQVRRVQTTVNLREGPGDSFAALMQMKPGQKVELVGISRDGIWAKVRVGNGGAGWVRRQSMSE